MKPSVFEGCLVTRVDEAFDIFHYAINSIVFFALARYRFPIEGLCIILACVTAVGMWDRVFQKRRTA